MLLRSFLLVAPPNENELQKLPIKITVEEAYPCADLMGYLITADGVLSQRWGTPGMDNLTPKNEEELRNPLLSIMKANVNMDEDGVLTYASSCMVGWCMPNDTLVFNNYLSVLGNDRIFPLDVNFKWSRIKQIVDNPERPPFVDFEEYDVYNLSGVKKRVKSIILEGDDIQSIKIEKSIDEKPFFIRFVELFIGARNTRYNVTFAISRSGQAKLRGIERRDQFFFTTFEIIGKKYYLSQTYDQVSGNPVLQYEFTESDKDLLEANYKELIE